MPILLPFKTKPISDDEFHAIDRRVMGMVFDIHNDFGRLWREHVYRNVVKMINVVSGNRVTGTQKAQLLNNDIAFSISSKAQNDRFYECHLRRFIRHTMLKAIQWINFNHNRIEFRTILR